MVKYLILVCSLCITIPAKAQKVWEKKPYQQWSMSDVIQILSDSPWAQTQIEEGHDGFGPYFITIQLRSATIIRQALVRQRQLHLNYDKFTPSDKAKFDMDVKEFLECSDCPKYYIITLGSKNDSYPIRALKETPLDKLKPYVSLTNDQGERRELVRLVLPKSEGGDVMLVFERFDAQGKPLLMTNNRKFYFKIDEKVFEGKAPPIKKFTFEVPKLIYQGEIVF